MGLRAIVGVSTVGTAMLLAGTTAASAGAPQTCTWGGTPVAATGHNKEYPGITNTPSTQPIHFRATGPLGGQCQGTFVFDGIVDVGATCSYITFHGSAHGLSQFDEKLLLPS